MMRAKRRFEDFLNSFTMCDQNLFVTQANLTLLLVQI